MLLSCYSSFPVAEKQKSGLMASCRLHPAFLLLYAAYVVYLGQCLKKALPVDAHRQTGNDGSKQGGKDMRFSKFRYWRLPLAGVIGFCGLVLIWLAYADVPPPMANAISDRHIATLPPDEQAYTPSDEEARLLQASVDSVAISLGSLMEKIADPTSRKTLLATALNTLTYELGGEVFFTAWQGTRVIHSPMSPDAAYMDFATALDMRGTPFVVEMAQAARKGGGFIQVLLPLPLPRQREAHEEIRKNDTSRMRGIVTAAVSTSSRSIINKEPVEQMLYIRPIPYSNWHIAAFMPSPPALLADISTHTTASGPPPEQKDLVLLAQGRLRAGLGLSGLSLAGMAGLLLASGSRRYKGQVWSPHSE